MIEIKLLEKLNDHRQDLCTGQWQYQRHLLLFCVQLTLVKKVENHSPSCLVFEL